jgi:hypothetical protein
MAVNGLHHSVMHVMRTSYIIWDGLRKSDHSVRQFAVLISSGWI